MSVPDIESAFSRKLLLFTGKGGVGKSYLARMFARKAASLGKRVLLIEINHKSQHNSFLNIGDHLHQIQCVDNNLFHINIVYEYNFRDYVVKYLGMEKVFNQVFGQNLIRSFLRTVPGLNEITFLGRLYFECCINQDDAFDLVIFDGFSSGHFLKLMTTPDGIERSGLVGPVLNETRNIYRFLQNESLVQTIFVSNPEKLVAGEMLEFLDLLTETTPLRNISILLNRCLRSNSQLLSKLQGQDLRDFLLERQQIQNEIITSIKQHRTDQNHTLYCSYLTPPSTTENEQQLWQDLWQSLALSGEV